MKLSKARNRIGSPPSPGINFNMRCSCGSTISGIVSPPTYAIQIRDVFLSFHRRDECTVTDRSTDVGDPIHSATSGAPVAATSSGNKEAPASG